MRLDGWAHLIAENDFQRLQEMHGSAQVCNPRIIYLSKNPVSCWR